MSEIEVFSDIDNLDDNDASPELDAANDSKIVMSGSDVRRKIEDMLERKRLREEFGDLDF